MRIFFVFCIVITMIIGGCDSISFIEKQPIQDSYDKFMRENNITNVGALPQINDNLIVYEEHILWVWDKKTNELNDFPQFPVFTGCEYVEATVIDKKWRKIRKLIIKEIDIRPVKSNWGLTQDIEQINERMERNKLKP